MEDKITHLAFSDESNYHKNKGFASICLITLKKVYFDELNLELKKILKESGTGEFKWNYLKGAKYRFCGQKLLEFAFKHKKKLRIDIIIWDISERKYIYKEHKLLSLRKMYFHLFKDILKKRWGNDCIWMLFPDEQSAINWNKSKEILDNISSELIAPKEIKDISEITLKTYFKIEAIQEVNSRNNPFCQIADLFSGMACFSYNSHNLLACSSSQKFLSEKNHNESLKEKANLLNLFRKLSKENNLNFIIDKGLITLNPQDAFINFWKFKFKDYSKKEKSLNNWF